MANSVDILEVKALESGVEIHTSSKVIQVNHQEGVVTGILFADKKKVFAQNIILAFQRQVDLYLPLVWESGVLILVHYMQRA
jgi:hypothetical protein